MLKYIFFTADNLINPVAQKLQEEGAEVSVGQIQDLKFTLTADELKNDVKPEESACKEKRLSMGKGLVNQKDAVDVIKALKKLDPKDYFVAADLNSCFAFTQKAYEAGFTGMLALEEDRQLEVARDEAKEIVKKNYPDLNLMECKEFTKAKDGIKFLEESGEVWVQKSKGDSGETICPKIDDPKLANQELIDILEESPKAYEENGFMLEQKIVDGVELTPQAVFYDGKLVFTDLDIETKTIGGAEKGPNVGCGTNLIIRTDPDDKINRMAFPPYIHELAAKRKGMFIIDAGIIFDKRTNKPYFTEFCFQRFGWDAFPTELKMCKSVSDYFESIVKGKNPLKKRFGAGVRLFNMCTDKERHPEGDLTIGFHEEVGKSLFLYDSKEENGKIVSVGFQKDLGVAVGVGDSVKEAINACYEAAQSVAFNDLYYRSKDDFLSKSYPQAVLNRLEYAVKNDLIEDDGILEDIREGGGLEGLTKFVKGYAEERQKILDEKIELLKELENQKVLLEQKNEEKKKLSADHAKELAKVKQTVKEILEENDD